MDNRLSVKVSRSIRRLQDFCPPSGYYLAFSGGKDSCVVKELMDLSGVPYRAVYRVTSVDPPELVRFVRDVHPDVKREVPLDKFSRPVTMWNLIPRKNMPPTFRVRYCCSELKESAGDGQFTVTGVRWDESFRRSVNHGVVDVAKKPSSGFVSFLSTLDDFEEKKNGFILVNDNSDSRRIVESCIKRTKTVLNPIVDWDSIDVWSFINKYNVKYCSLYDEGFDRIGCIGCPLICSERRKIEFERWPKYKNAYLVAFDKLSKKLKDEGKLENSKFGPDAYSMFRWWLRES